jgi:hypothetical protein
VLTPAQPVPPAAGGIFVNCAPHALLRRGKGHGRLLVGGRKWDEAHDRVRNVGIVAAIALLIFASTSLIGREPRDFVAIDTSLAMRAVCLSPGSTPMSLTSSAFSRQWPSSSTTYSSRSVRRPSRHALRQYGGRGEGHHQVPHRPPASDDPRRGPAAGTRAAGFRTTWSTCAEERPRQPSHAERDCFPIRPVGNRGTTG